MNQAVANVFHKVAFQAASSVIALIIFIISFRITNFS